MRAVVAALLLRPLEIVGRFFFAERLQTHGLHVVHFVCEIRIIVHGNVFRLPLIGFGADFLVDFGFELKAAFQAAATAGNVLRIQRKALLFRHFHVDAVESVEELRAAERAAACSDAAENGRFVAHTDLPQFDAHFQKAGKIAEEFAEVDSSVCGELEDDESLVEGVMRLDEFHLKAMRLDAFKRFVMRCKCLDVIVFRFVDVFLRGDAEDLRDFLAFDMAAFCVHGALPFEFRFVQNGIAADFRDFRVVEIAFALDDDSVVQFQAEAAFRDAFVFEAGGHFDFVQLLHNILLRYVFSQRRDADGTSLANGVTPMAPPGQLTDMVLRER